MAQILESLSVIFISPFRDSLSAMLWCVFASALLVLLYLTYRRQTLGKAIRLLTEAGCVDAESARNLEDLGGSKRLASAVERSRDRLLEKVTEEGKTRYFLPEDRKKKAQYFLKASGSGVKNTLLSVAGLYAVLVALYYILPFVFPEYFGNF